jgi:sugar O-acyltransferase (sialic acid O-acetyltransferase NeuD family)
MKLICLGANNPETIRIINAIKAKDQSFHFLGFIDNDESKWGTQFYGYPVLGGTDLVHRLSKEGTVFCNLITRDCLTRYETTKAIIERGGQLANIVHPTVNLQMVRLGVGNYIQENAILQACVSVGNNSSISFGSLVGHETTVGSSVFIAHGCSISGKITIDDGVFVGAGATILPRISIGKWSIIGAGAVIIRDVEPFSVVVGNPGKIIKAVDQSLKPKVHVDMSSREMPRSGLTNK